MVKVWGYEVGGLVLRLRWVDEVNGGVRSTLEERTSRRRRKSLSIRKNCARRYVCVCMRPAASVSEQSDGGVYESAAAKSHTWYLPM